MSGAAPARAGLAAPPPLRWLGRTAYDTTLLAMREAVERRTPGDGADEIWLTEHDPVYTLGQAGRMQHVLAPGRIPVVQVERGGQVTYHGPGQVVAYPLVELRRFGQGPRSMVCLLERAVLAVLAGHGVAAVLRDGAPGVYVADGGAKIASIGLKIRRGISYHGVALNVAMDLSPFDGIDPCGYPGQRVTDLAHEMAGRPVPEPAAIADALGRQIALRLAGLPAGAANAGA